MLAIPRVKRLLSQDHFSVDGTLIQAWASMKSFRPKDDGTPPAPPEPPEGGRNAEVDFHGQRLSNDTHRSITDPEARLYRKGRGREAKLSFMGHALMENRHGLIVDGCVTEANGHAERTAALAMIEKRADRPNRINLGSISDAVLSCRLGLQILGRRTASGVPLNEWTATADYGLDVACVIGEAMDAPKAFAGVTGRISLLLNDVTIGRGADIGNLMDPLATVLSLARALHDQGTRLEVGDTVAVGSCTGLTQVVPGQQVMAVFDGRRHVYAYNATTRRSRGSRTRKLSVIRLEKRSKYFGTV